MHWALLIVAVCVVASASGAEAGEYHVGPTLICADCHRASGDTSASSGLGRLKAAPNEVCLSCHDGQRGIPDVYGDDVNAVQAPRQAGALATGAAGYEDWKGHRLDSPGPPPGGAWPPGETRLECVSCHAPHGNANYRNLGGRLPSPPSVSYLVSTIPTNVVDVRIDLPALPPVGERVASGFYSPARTYFNRPSAAVSAYGAFCAICHAEFHSPASTGLGSPFRRHPVDVVGLSPPTAGRFNSHPNKVQVLAPSNSATAVYRGDASPSCMTCHRAHGNRNAFGLVFMKPTGPVTEQGVEGGVARDLCVQCHRDS